MCRQATSLSWDYSSTDSDSEVEQDAAPVVPAVLVMPDVPEVEYSVPMSDALVDALWELEQRVGMDGDGSLMVFHMFHAVYGKLHVQYSDLHAIRLRIERAILARQDMFDDGDLSEMASDLDSAKAVQKHVYDIIAHALTSYDAALDNSDTAVSNMMDGICSCEPHTYFALKSVTHNIHIGFCALKAAEEAMHDMHKHMATCIEHFNAGVYACKALESDPTKYAHVHDLQMPVEHVRYFHMLDMPPIPAAPIAPNHVPLHVIDEAVAAAAAHASPAYAPASPGFPAAPAGMLSPVYNPPHPAYDPISPDYLRPASPPAVAAPAAQQPVEFIDLTCDEQLPSDDEDVHIMCMRSGRVKKARFV
jgi:hypothetical protein